MADWHPIQNARACEWILRNGTFDQPYGVIRELSYGADKHTVTWYRLVTWSPTSSGRKLIGYHQDPKVLAELAWKLYCNRGSERRLEQNRLAGTNTGR